MKQILLFTLIATLLSCQQKKSAAIKPDQEHRAFKNISQTKQTPNCNILFSGDCGYIERCAGHNFLLAARLTDSTNFYWKQNPTDTIGKYYFIKETGNYYVYIMDCKEEYSFETSIVAEVTAKGALVQHERYLHSNYPSCLENYADGFGKCGNSYGVKICGTGSGYGATYLLLFKNISPQDSLEHIPISYWSQKANGDGEDLSSSINLSADKLTIYYTLKTGDYYYTDSFNIHSIRKFAVHYNFQHNKWVTAEKSKYKGLDISL